VGHRSKCSPKILGVQLKRLRGQSRQQLPQHTCFVICKHLALVGWRESKPERVNASAATRPGRRDVRSTSELDDAVQQDLIRGQLADEAMHLLTSANQERMSACAATVDLTGLLNCFCKFG